jgi:hypothetical protein
VTNLACSPFAQSSCPNNNTIEPALAIFKLSRVLNLHHVVPNLHRVRPSLQNLRPSCAPNIHYAPPNRSAGRNIHIYDANDPTTVLGGLILTNGVTNANFYSMVEILIITTSHFFLGDESNAKIERDNHPLQPGKYYIVAAGGFLHNHPFIRG